MAWLTASRKPYQTANTNLACQGNSGIFEIPISAIGLPYVGTFLRIAPRITAALRRVLHFEALIRNKPIVFLIHPNELIEEEISIQKIQRRSKNIVSYILGDIVRHKLKLKNLGGNAVSLYEKEICFFSKKNYGFITLVEYYNCYQNKKKKK